MEIEGNSKIVYEGPGVCTLLGVAFVVLKLTGYINWSWWLVTVPFWAPIVAVIALVIILKIIIAILQSINS